MSTAIQLQTQLMREYYNLFTKYSKGKHPSKPVAWVTSFAPVEILEALGISFYYPESYAAVIAASGNEQELLAESSRLGLSSDCCSYSCCIEGCISLEKGPRGMLPAPDVLIAANNQCNTLPSWWNMLAERYNVPLITVDYPGTVIDRIQAMDYVTRQHMLLTKHLEKLFGNRLDNSILENAVSNSAASVDAWSAVADSLNEFSVRPTTVFDAITFLIVSRCRPETSELYRLTYENFKQTLTQCDKDKVPLYWLGYPLWYHKDRYLSELLDGFRISGSNYITWWNLDYSGNDIYEKLFNAYNYTFLNLPQKERTKRLIASIKRSGAKAAISLHNKSCKCDFVSARNIDIPQAELEIDMIDRGFLDMEKAAGQISLLRELLCME